VRIRRCVSTVVSVAFLIAAHVALATAAPGDLDLTFGNEGVADLPFDPSVHAGGADAAVAPDGRIYVLRQRHLTCGTSGCDSQATVEGLLPDGSADNSFGSGGEVDLGDEQGTSLAVDSNGKVLVTTIDQIGTLTRLNPNGTVDESFGEKGRVHFGHNAGFPLNTGAGIYGAHVAVREDGRIVVASDQGTSTGSTQLELLQYLSNGAVDPSFGRGAAVTTDLQRDWGGIAFSGHGVMTLADAPCCTRSTPVQVASLLPDGTPNVAFGGGERIVETGDGTYVVAVLSLPGDRIAVVGAHYGGVGNAFALGFRPNGSLDRRFGRRGVLSLGGTFDSVGAAVADQKGRITVAGSARVQLPSTSRRVSLLTLRRFNSEGRVDRSFGGGSPVRLDRTRNLSPDTSVLQPDGRLLVLASRGYCDRSCSPFHLSLVRFIAGTAKARCLGRRATIVGTRRRDVLVGTPHRDVIVGLGGNDTIHGRGGNDLICGGPGKDFILGGPGRNRVRQ
jgi:uncharacterized delta-60 repeat protein